MPTLQEELNNEFIEKTVTITPSADNKEWTIKVDDVEETVPAGKDDTPQVATLPSAEGTTPYFPSKSFSQVKGTDLSTGLVITDEVDEEGNSIGNEYVWIEVPKTATTYGSSFNLNYDFDNMTDEQKNTAYTAIATALRGYVSDLIQIGTTSGNSKTTTKGWKDEWYDGCGIANADDYKVLYKKMLKSIYDNGGFYIGRYEAGTKTAKSSWDATSEIIPLSKVDHYPITTKCQDAQIIASRVQNIENCCSSLLFGIQWDLVLKYLYSNGISNDLLTGNSETWGNYNYTYNLEQNTVHGFKGILSLSNYRTLTWSAIENGYLHPVADWSTTSPTVLSTGATTRNSKKNIYDLAGNMFEWTLEHAKSNTSKPCCSRGGSFYDPGSTYPVSYRDNLGKAITNVYSRI